MTVVVTKTPQYPASQRATEKQWKLWPENVRLRRSCQVCGTTYLHAGAAWACERSPHGLPQLPG